MKDFFDTFGPSFLGLQILRLFSEIDKGGSKALAALPSKLPSRVASLLIYLKHCGPASSSELAKALSVSHQLASQRIDTLIKQSLVEKVSDPNDQRRNLIKLNAAGLNAADEVESLCELADQAYLALFEEIDVDLFSVVIKARQALQDRPIELRIRDIAASAKIKPAITPTD